MSKPKQLTDPTAERALIGALLLDPAILDLPEVARIERASFYTEFYGVAFTCAQTHYQAGRIPDIALLSRDLEEQGASDAFGKLAGIITDDRPEVWNAPEYAHRVADLADRRAALREVEQAAAAIYNRNGDWKDHVAGAGVYLAMLDERGKAENVNRPGHKTSWTAAELLTTDFQRPPFVVDGLLLAGLTMLGGRPKIGKSWLALQLVQAVGTGGMFLGQPATQGRCLYLALEDPPWRLAERMRAQRWEDAAAQVDFQTVGSLRAGRSDELAAMIREGLYKLVVVDTLSRALAGDQNDGQAMNAALTPLQEAAHAAAAAVVMVDHHNKIGSATSGAGDGEGLEPDVIVNLAGAISKGGIADSIWGLYRNKGRRGATLVVTGRDIEEQSLTLQQDPLTHVWQPMTEGGEVKQQLSRGRSDVLDAIQGLGGEATFTEVTKTVSMQRSNVYHVLQDLVNLGYLTFTNRRYAIFGDEQKL